MIVKNIIKLIRPAQWVKNLFIFLPLFFSGQLMNLDIWLACLPVFFAFSFISSSLYCFNDIRDREEDRLHPIKKNRPIANGSIRVREGYGMMVVLLVSGFLLLLLSENKNTAQLLGVLAFYYVMNIAYSLKLKRISIIDILIVALGFVLRLLAGGFASGIPLSQWIVLMTFLLALFLALGKRGDDIGVFEQTGVTLRRNIQSYNTPFFNVVVGLLSTITIVCYIMYSVSEEVTQRFDNQYIYLTSVFVITGFIRYLQILLVEKGNADPTHIFLHDRFLQACILGWLLSFALIIYF